MNSLNIGDIVQNSIQRSIVRWIGEIEEILIIGLQSLDSTLPGYTDGTCPFDGNRYFDCPRGQGYYILETGFNSSYKIVNEKRETRKLTTSDDEFNSAEQSLSTSPANGPYSPEPIPSTSSPTVSQIQHNSDHDHVTSPSRGVLSRLAFEREQRKIQVSPPIDCNKNSYEQRSSVESEPQSSRRYQPENYRSTSYERTDKPQFSAHNSVDENNTGFSLLPSATTSNRLPSMDDAPLFGHEHFLDTWTLGRVKNLLENQIPPDSYFCLNAYNDQCNVQNLIDEQINGCLSLPPTPAPNDVRIELIKLYDHVETIFPSRAISLYGNDYLLLAILCSNNNCAYIRTSEGWAYSDAEGDHGECIIVDEISRMIDDLNGDIQYQSEQCRHLLKDASFLYYKLVE